MDIQLNELINRLYIQNLRISILEKKNKTLGEEIGKLRHRLDVLNVQTNIENTDDALSNISMSMF